MSLELLVPLTALGLPVAIVWIRSHYRALEKGHIGGGSLVERKRVAQLEAQNQELLERVQNLESIVVGLDEPKPQQKLASSTKMMSDE
ncbi:MAG: hypothetical protein ABI321_10345 [Polyangia bacterium]